MELVLWWLSLTAFYLLLITSPTGIEVPVGLAVGGTGAVLAVAGRRAFGPASRLPTFLRYVAWLPVDIAADAVTMCRLLLTGRAFRHDAGSVEQLTLDDDLAQRTWAVILVSASPGSLAAEVEERDGKLLLTKHRLTRHDRAIAGLRS